MLSLEQLIRLNLIYMFLLDAAERDISLSQMPTFSHLESACSLICFKDLAQ